LSRRLIVSEFVTLDGVMEAPGFEEHRDPGKNAWALRAQSDELQRFISEQFMRVDAFLLGRTTYLIWAAFWPTADQDAEFTKRMNATKKYVVSTSLREASWENTEILGDDWPERIAEIKELPGEDILVNGSADLVNGLMEHDLVDLYQLMLFPLVLGSGKHLFRDATPTHHMRLTATNVFGDGVVVLTYEPRREPPPSSVYEEQYSWTDEQVRALQAAEDVNRILATVLFTDIVGSSEKAAAMGDRRWRVVLDRHDEIVRAEVTRWHGELVKSTGDGILATFDTPTRALRCAFGLADSLAAFDLKIRAGIHTGEVELRGGDLGGIALHIASRALASAEEGGVVVTRTVRDLASGSDLSFSPLGPVSLRGIPGEWELFAASTSSGPSPHRLAKGG
jgi:class 3 adenylate cyclase/dihydrofolate reductase